MEMPEITHAEIQIILWKLTTTGSSERYKAWAEYCRYAYPTSTHNFILEEEATFFRGWLPFDHGDHWEQEGTTWVIVKPDGTRIPTNKPRPKET